MPQSTERPLLDDATIEANVAGIGALLSRLLPAAASDGADGALAAPLVLNNMAWFGGMPLLDFLRDVGKHARVGVMLSKDSVKARMGTPGAEGEAGEGMSYTEFTYQLLQACVLRCCCARRLAACVRPDMPRTARYDFSYLFKEHNVSVQVRRMRRSLRTPARADVAMLAQIGGSDQWGNITAGTDLIRRVQARDGAFGAAACELHR